MRGPLSRTRRRVSAMRATLLATGVLSGALALAHDPAADPAKTEAWTPVPAVVAVNAGVAGMLLAGLAVARRPKDSLTLALASATALLAGLATHPEWDSVRLMQWVMAGVAGAVAVLVLLPQTAQRVAVSLFVLYHFAGILSAITSPHPQPWMTAQLWSRVFRPHLEFCYVNNAYQFYSPQPGPAGRGGTYEVRHGFGYSRWRHERDELLHEVETFVAAVDPVEALKVE